MGQENGQVFDRDYPVRRLLAIVADAWTPIVLYCLSQGTLRFSALHRRIPDISKKMLTQVLRRLEQQDLVHRKVYPVVPPHTEYSLTDEGKRLHEPIQSLCNWAHKNEALLERVLARSRQN